MLTPVAEGCSALTPATKEHAAARYRTLVVLVIEPSCYAGIIFRRAPPVKGQNLPMQDEPEREV